MSFAATHVGWVPIGAVVPASVFGFLLCLLYHWTGSLYPPLALHALLNSLLAGTALASTWKIPRAVVLAVVATLAMARLVAVLLGAARSRLD